jgi:hypothetical protein
MAFWLRLGFRETASDALFIEIERAAIQDAPSS